MNVLRGHRGWVSFEPCKLISLVSAGALLDDEGIRVPIAVLLWSWGWRLAMMMVLPVWWGEVWHGCSCVWWRNAESFKASFTGRRGLAVKLSIAKRRRVRLGVVTLLYRWLADAWWSAVVGLCCQWQMVQGCRLSCHWWWTVFQFCIPLFRCIIWQPVGLLSGFCCGSLLHIVGSVVMITARDGRLDGDALVHTKLRLIHDWKSLRPPSCRYNTSKSICKALFCYLRNSLHSWHNFLSHSIQSSEIFHRKARKNMISCYHFQELHNYGF